MSNQEENIKNKGGRPTKYKEEYNEQVLKLSLLGATDVEMADFFDISKSTFNEWKKKYPKFSDSIKKGKDEADIAIVASLFQKAKGFTKKVKKAVKLRESETGVGSKEKVVMVDEEQYYAPDTTAIIFWLKNRQPDKWRDKKELKADVTNTSVDIDEDKLKQIEQILYPD